MKNHKFLIAFSALILVCVSCVNKNTVKENNTEINLAENDTSANRTEEKIAFIKDFYTQYIANCDKMPPDVAEYNLIKQKYLSPRLINEWASADLDYDPVLNAQDCDISTINTLKITEVENNIYSVCYTWVDSTDVCIVISLIENEKGFLIDNTK